MHTDIYTDTYRLTHIHAYTHTYTHTHTHTYIHIYTRMYTYTHEHTHTKRSSCSRAELWCLLSLWSYKALIFGSLQRLSYTFKGAVSQNNIGVKKRRFYDSIVRQWLPHSEAVASEHSCNYKLSLSGNASDALMAYRRESRDRSRYPQRPRQLRLQFLLAEMSILKSEVPIFRVKLADSSRFLG